jgi:hypothetical protein
LNPFARMHVRFADDPTPDPDEEENFKLFGKFFDRASKDPKWLEAVKGSLSSGVDKVTEAPKELAGFLTRQVEKLETEKASLSERLEAARDLLTPEQLIQWRSAKPGNVDPTKPKPNDPPNDPPPPPPPKPRKKWL